MAVIRDLNTLIQNAIDFLRTVQPNADTKPGTVIRDIFVDLPANQQSLIYQELSDVQNLQSLRNLTGSQLDNWANNFNITRKQATQASGVAVLTVSELVTPIGIQKGSSVYSNNGIAYSINTSTVMAPANANFYRSVAARYRNDLDFAGITDQYAIEVSVTASSAGTAGNIGKFSLVRSNISGITNVTNPNPFAGGTNQENDTAYRNRILSVFNGASVGTSLGYYNTALAVDGVADAAVIEPGDTLMVRDGTVVATSSDGTKVIVSEGTGGKVDVIILGSSVIENVDSFIYRDKSNTNDPTNSKNDFTLGQISGTEKLTISQKRKNALSTGNVPAQPVDSIVQVSGSLSGSNFVEKTVDQYGRVSGNYELLKDTGLYSGSPWGYDKFHWISNKISGFEEEAIKGQPDGQDNTIFTDVLNIPKITQNVSISNENSLILSNRSQIKLLHTPCNAVTRVFNTNTGERYIVTDQGVDDTTKLNTSGIIQISGNTLPSPSDVLQVDYIWVVEYDQFTDYDGKLLTSNLRPSVDSIDWGYSSLIKNEKTLFVRDVSGSFYTGKLSHQISSILSANSFYELTGYVSEAPEGIYYGRYQVVIENIPVEPTSISSIKLLNSTVELYNTSDNNGVYSLQYSIDGYKLTVILPTDVGMITGTSNIVSVGDFVKVTINSTDTFYVDNLNGTTVLNTVTIPATNLTTTANEVYLNVNYIADVDNLFTSPLLSLPSSRFGNSYKNSSLGFTNTYQNNIYYRENQLVKQNLSLQFYIEVSTTNISFSISQDDVLSIIRLSDGKELWNKDNQGTISVNNTNNAYQFILSGFNTPVLNDRILVIYKGLDITKFQPFSFSNEIILSRVGQLFDYNTTHAGIYVNNIDSENPVTFDILSSENSDILTTRNDGYIVSSLDNSYGYLYVTGAFLFSSISGISFKKIKVYGSINDGNNQVFDILEVDFLNNRIKISNYINKINKNQISIVRLDDNKELWNDSCTIDVTNNILLIPKTPLFTAIDKVYLSVYNYSNLRKSPTKVSVTVNDQVTNTGSLSLVGTTLTKVSDVVFSVATADANYLKLNLVGVFQDIFGNIPSNVGIAKIAKIEKVTTISDYNNEVLSTVAIYDVKNTKIKYNTLYSDDNIQDLSLSNYEFILPKTQINLSSSNTITNGTKLRITFYYYTSSDSESIVFTRNGTLFSNKKFAFLDKVIRSSGFNQSQSSQLALGTFTQPASGNRYTAVYDYLAPKSNERIVIRTNYNKMVTDVTFAIEQTRPINADVIVKQASEISVNTTMYIVIDTSYIQSSATITQNVRDAIINILTSTILGGTIDSSDLVNAAYQVEGVDRSRITYFNKDGQVGQVLSITAEKNEYFTAGTVTVLTETR